VLRNDEVGALSEATNLMLDRLERSDRERLVLHATLEHKVEERTALLRDANDQIACDFEARSRMELELRQAQRLEAIGRLAAGIAHEINTPLQFVSDSLQFVRAGTGDMLELALGPGKPGDEDIDLPYLRDHLPQAIERALEGLGRVTTIVRSMKAFAHPDRSAPAEIDLNQTITSTLMIARNEYKYVAELETDFGELPRVTCWVGDFNQVIVNLVVNAAHAIGDIVGTSGAKGRIRVTTRCDGPDVVVEIADTGGGIPESAREYIFEPFFTTKEIGKGTGQGLAIARSVIVDKHHGSIDFESVPGTGTTFTLRIPIVSDPTGASTAHAA
jgi:signal transduction histidine kinase